MTSIVGVLCRDGIVIGTDGSATFSQNEVPTIEQSTRKLNLGPNSVIVAATGEVGHAQRFFWIYDQVFESVEQANAHYLAIGKSLSRSALEDFAFTHSKADCAALVGFPLDQEFYLCEFSPGDFQPEFKDFHVWYVSMGSGQHITDPFLALMRDVFWTEGPPQYKKLDLQSLGHCLT